MLMFVLVVLWKDKSSTRSIRVHFNVIPGFAFTGGLGHSQVTSDIPGQDALIWNGERNKIKDITKMRGLVIILFQLL